MAGELWRGAWGFGLETDYGDPVAATRKFYARRDSVMSPDQEARNHHFAVGRRDNRLAITYGPQQPAGRVSLPLSPSECLELFDLGITGSPVITTPGGGTNSRLHTYVPGDLASATVEWDDAARPWQIAGVMVNSLTFEGSANGDQIVTAELFGKAFAPNALTTGLADRVPDFYQGFEGRWFMDAIGGTPGTTPYDGVLASYRVTLNNQLGRSFRYANLNAMHEAVSGELDAMAEVVVEASEDFAIDEFNHWINDDTDGRLGRLELGNNDIIEGSLKSFVTIDLPGKWATFDLGNSDAGKRVYGARLSYLYDATNAFGFQLRAQCDRLAAFTE